MMITSSTLTEYVFLGVSETCCILFYEETLIHMEKAPVMRAEIHGAGVMKTHTFFIRIKRSAF